ncbi:Bug family tripartite tricarboxylate transporter substrate binding protein [Halomonas litopenaei]|uniref:Bug family tripartite tricarboxylate transporter substrate binding protein n=1 Tax=Halomonas litopenaei TaxID=2109328 RepID=UPI003F9F320B
MTYYSNKKNALVNATSAALFFIAASAQADFPNKNIEFVVTYAPGGTSDIASRTFVNSAKQYFDENIFVQNRPGAGGLVGTDYVYNANPDGHIIQLARVGVFSVAPTVQDIPYEPDEFTYLGMISTDPFACVTGADSEYSNIQDLADDIKEAPGTVTYTSSGVGSLNQFAALRLLDLMGVEDPKTAAIHVPGKGGGPALSSVAGGHIDFFCGPLSPITPQVKAGNLTALFVTSDSRIEALSDVPTAAEIGYEGMEDIIGWSGIVGPPGMPEEAISFYEEVLSTVAEDEDWISKVEDSGAFPNVILGDEFKEIVSRQREGFATLAERVGL